ncbi:DUF4256 domain-containing protein [Belliella sp. DSM 107340]|uniref:DUF4256 domain-containing protein n=1 Tax=Belliella calami TaxID=2923436 RepID=A0ABS9UPH6_9BACT|nr:DUF4256 domain-containing protein [Belliella calami]MCH7398304.1 DUF4256 domain-containing protein [Belliella calami]
MKKELSQQESETLFNILKSRFEKNMHRHEGIDWDQVQKRLEINPEKSWSIYQMELTGGEPDVVGFEEDGGYVFCDFAAETPKGRRSVCYDHEALESRKTHKPKNSAMGMAEEMGIELMTEEQYLKLQLYGKLDTKTSSWLATPSEIRQLGGAIFGDWRFGRVFIYHNGADSYYGVRGFRGIIRV